MLDRIALHQTRLRTPGISLDAKGIALGAKGLVLLSSLDRLVGFLSLYTRHASLADLVGSLSIEVVRSKLGTREVTMTFNADSSERMDRMAELARLSGGHIFTGTKRHFVQYRDASAPFGYDVREISPTDAPIALNHTTFSQHYESERSIDVARLVLQLEPHVAPDEGSEPGPRWICAEAGLGPALIHYFVRSRVDAEVGVAEWPPESGFDQTPLRRYLFRLESVPERMIPLLRDTPGIGVFVPAGESAAVEAGYRHPINLRACPVFPAEGLVLLRGVGRPAITVERLPELGEVASFAKVRFVEGQQEGYRQARATETTSVQVPLRLAPDPLPWRDVTATLVPSAQLATLRQLAYRLSRPALEQTTIAFTPRGAFLVRAQGIDGIPVGDFFRQVHPQLYVSAGFCPVPAIAPEVLFRAFGSPADELVFLHRDGNRFGVHRGLFVPLEQALLDAQTWNQLTAERIAGPLTTPLPQVSLGDPGFRPMRDLPDGTDPSAGGAGGQQHGG
ncbi:MAG: hypothetical protein JRI23_35960 [Deltaproteobacteria bacterium]|nr:hypothetical protein [Deltaproteobacteria bacterium]MBW2537745.1 hypothetical protein [Deltaproteobacteria bacterium]